MFIKSLSVTHFRSIEHDEAPIDRLTAFVGPNGAGKSSFLKAIELFYVGSAKVDVDDFYNEDITQDIEIALTFGNLPKEAQDQFHDYLEKDELTVVRVIRYNNGKPTASYHGYRKQYPPFGPIRAAEKATAKRKAYEQVTSLAECASLPSWTNQDAVEASLRDWEAHNLEKCQRERDDGQFFGFSGVANGYLGRYTKCLLVPAVRDAEDEAADSKNSTITDLMDLVVRRNLANRSDIVDLQKEAQVKYKEMLDPDKCQELHTLEGSLSGTLGTYVPGGEVKLTWQDGVDIQLPMPRAQVRLVEDGYSSSVRRTGHGLQRAFVFTLLQHLVMAQHDKQYEEPTDGTMTAPNLVLCIEEPELYQHPNRQRHLAQVLRKLSDGSIPGVAKGTQVIYTTHSPLFVGLDRFDQIRIVRKYPISKDMPPCSRNASTAMSVIAKRLWEATGKIGPVFTSNTLTPRLQAVMTPWVNEGFFADVCVLVEGEDDRAAIIGAAEARRMSLEASGVAVIPCVGKNNLDRPYLIFSSLGIPTYIIWDADSEDDKKGDAKKANRQLLRVLGETEADYPSGVYPQYACFQKDLTSTLKEEYGDAVYKQALLEIEAETMISDEALIRKKPLFYQRLVELAAKSGKSSPTISSILDQINLLRVLPEDTAGSIATTPHEMAEVIA